MVVFQNMISVVHIRYCKLNEKEDAKVIKSDDKNG